MKRFVAIIVATALAAPPASAGQKPAKPINWEKVQKLKAGTEITLTVAGGQATRTRLLFIDATMLLTLNPARGHLSSQVERTLLGIGTRWPAALQGRLTVDDGHVRVGPDGVFDGNQKVGTLAELTLQTPRGDVQGLTEVHTERNIAVGLVIAVGALYLIVGMICRGPTGCGA